VHSCPGNKKTTNELGGLYKWIVPLGLLEPEIFETHYQPFFPIFGTEFKINE